MSFELDYNTMFHVIDSWDRLRRIHDYERVAGATLFQRLFEKCPATKSLFGFPLDMDVNSEKLLKSKRFIMHASYMIQMLDKALNLLGPDVELLAEILSDLGKKHARYGVKKEYFQFMGEALQETLQATLKGNYTEEDEDAWTKVYDNLSGALCESMSKEKVVLESWGKLKAIDNYQNIAGPIIFQSLFEKCPPVKILFGFPIDMNPKSEVMVSSRRFKMHSSYFIEMLDSALCMMEKEELEENMEGLGKMHSTYGVKPEYFPLMGEALIAGLKKMLREDFNLEVEKAWMEVYDELSSQMVKAMN